jgi:hypothetical protein
MLCMEPLCVRMMQLASFTCVKLPLSIYLFYPCFSASISTFSHILLVSVLEDFFLEPEQDEFRCECQQNRMP